MNLLDREIAIATENAKAGDEKQKRAEAELLALDKLQVSGLKLRGPKAYDYAGAVMEGHDLEESEEGGFNLPNKHNPSGLLAMNGIDIATGRNVQNGSMTELEKRGAAELREGYINTDRGAPPMTIVPLAKLAYAHAMRGGTLEDFREQAPDSYGNMLEQAWSIGHGAAATFGLSQLIKDNEIAGAHEDVAPLIELPEMTTEELRASPEFLSAARTVLTSISGQEFEGDDDMLFEAAVNEMANFNWDPVTTSRRALRILNGSYPPEVVKAYGLMMQYYQATGTDWDIFKKSLWHGVTSPANLIGIATIGGAIVGKTGQKAVQKMVMKYIQSKIMQAAIVPGAVAAAEGAMYGALDAKAREFIMKEGGWDVSEMPSPWQGALLGAGVGTFFGGTFGAALSRPARQEFMQFMRRVEDNWKHATFPQSGTPQAQRGSIDLSGPDTPVTYKDQGLIIYDTEGEGLSRLTEVINDPKIGIIGKKPLPASEVVKRIKTQLAAKGGARFSAEEVRDTRLIEFLEQSKDELVTREQIGDWLYANRNRVSLVDSKVNPEGTGSMYAGGRTPEGRLERAYADAIGERTAPITVRQEPSPDHIKVKTYLEKWVPRLREASKLDSLEIAQINKGEMDPSMRGWHEFNVQNELERKHRGLIDDVEGFDADDMTGYYHKVLNDAEEYIAGRSDEPPVLPEPKTLPIYEWTNPKTGEKFKGKEQFVKDRRAQWVIKEYGEPKHSDMLAYLRQNDETMLKGGPAYEGHVLFDDPATESQAMANMFADDRYLQQIPADAVDTEYRELRFFLPFQEDSAQTIAENRFGKVVTELTDDEMKRVRQIQSWMRERAPQGEGRFEDIGVKSHFLGDVNRMAHVRLNKVWDDAGDELIFINEIQSDMRNYARMEARGEGMDMNSMYSLKEIAIETARRKSAYENGKFFDSAEDASLLMTVNHLLKQGQTRIALPANVEQLARIEQWDSATMNSKMAQTILRKYTKEYPKYLKKRFGDKVTIETKKVYGQPGSSVGQEVTVITIDPSVANQKWHLNGWIAAPGVATSTIMQDDNNRHATRDKKGRFIKDKK